MSLPTIDTRDATAPIPAADMKRLLAGVVLASARALFREYGVVVDGYEVQRRQPDPLANLFTLVAVGCQGMRGTIALGASQGPLRRSFPCRATERDWIAELGNQLTGRVKNELLRVGVALQPALPIVVTRGRLSWAGSGDYQFWNMDTDDGVVSVGIDVDVAETIVPDPVLMNWDVPLEGEALLF